MRCCAQDPNARNCHGYRKFVKRSVLESPNNGYLAADTIVIRYTIELVVSTGGALTRQAGPAGPKLPIIEVCGRETPPFSEDHSFLEACSLKGCGFTGGPAPAMSRPVGAWAQGLGVLGLLCSASRQHVCSYLLSGLRGAGHQGPWVGEEPAKAAVRMWTVERDGLQAVPDTTYMADAGACTHARRCRRPRWAVSWQRCWTAATAPM